MPVPPGTTGDIVNEASVTPPEGVDDPDTGNNTARLSLSPSAADLAITKTNGTDTYTPGMTTAYRVTVTNNGPSDVQGAVVEDQLPPGITTANWTCGEATDGGTCGAASGTGGIDTTVDLPAGASVTYRLTMHVPSTFVGPLTNIATVTAPADITDPDLDNNTDMDTDTEEQNPVPPSCDMSANGSFETPNVQNPPYSPGGQVSNGLVAWRSGVFTLDGWETVEGTIDINRWMNNTTDGMQSIDLWGTAPATFRQTFTGLIPGRQYMFSVDYSGLSSTQSIARLQLGNGEGVAPVTIATLRPVANAINNGVNAPPTNTQYTVTWATFRHEFTAASTEATIQFVSDPNPGPFYTGLFIDNFVFTSPDPCEADLAIEKTSENGSYGYVPEEDIVYKIKVSNLGTTGIRNAVVRDELPAGFTTASWTCESDTEGTPGTCSVRSGTGGIDDVKVNLPGGGSVVFTLTMPVPPGTTGDIVNEASVTPPADVTDTDDENNWAEVTLHPAQPAFACDATMYWSHQHLLRSLDISVNPPALVDLAALNFHINALGFNPQDGYLYALQTSTNVLVRFGSDGSAQVLGPVKDLPVARYDAGEFDPDGNYYVRSGTSAVLYKIDVSRVRVAQPIALTSNSGRPLNVSYDLAWHKGLLYFQDGSGSTTNIIRAIDPGTGVVTDIGQGTALGEVGAAWGDPNNVFIGNGNVYAVNTIDGFVRWITSRWDGRNQIFPDVDGAKCPTYAVEFPADLKIEKTTTRTSYRPGEDVVYTVTVTNNGPFGVHDARVTDLLPDGITEASWSCYGPGPSNGGWCGQQASSPTITGDGPIEDFPVHLFVGNSVTFQLTVPVPADFPGGDLINTARVDNPAGSPDPDEENNTDEALLRPVPRITIAKVTEAGTGSFTFNGLAASANGFPMDGTYEVATENAGVAALGQSRWLAAEGAVTQIIEDVPPGWVLTRAICEDLNAAVTGNPPGQHIGTVSDGRTLVIPAEYARRGGNLLCTFTNRRVGFVLSGRVILDNGLDGGTAHDGVPNGGEKGFAGAAIRLTDCGATDHARTITDGAGGFSLTLPAALSGETCVVLEPVGGHLGVSGNIGDTDGTLSASHDEVRFTPAPDTAYSDVVFGMIALPSFTGDNSVVVTAGSSVALAHRYSATTSGVVSFTFENETAMPGPAAFSYTLYKDDGCSGTLGDEDRPLTTMVGVEAGEEICLIVLVQAVSGIPAGARLAYDLVATTALANLAAALTAANHDTVTASTAGTIALSKRVRNISSGGEAGPFAVSSSGSPGDVLEYAIIFTNPSKDAVSNVQVFDETPAFTRLAEPMAVEREPSGMQCAPSVPPGGGSSDYAGDLQWECTGSMAGGGEGEVRFRVRIEE
jgi:uncharacterized repeat protein (TIGR01451 family)